MPLLEVVLNHGLQVVSCSESPRAAHPIYLTDVAHGMYVMLIVEEDVY